MTSTLTISLICATMGRRDELRRFLDSVITQTHPPLEVILVDQNPIGFLGDIIQDYSHSLPLKVVRSEVAGLSISRNIGVEESSGDILLFPDDDCAYTENYIKSIYSVFIEYSIDVFHGNYYDSNLDIFHFPDHSKDNIHMNADQALIYGSSICLGVNREVFFQLDGFDTRMGLGDETICSGSEDIEFICRSIAKKKRTILFPKIYCLHSKESKPMSSRISWKRNRSAFVATIYISIKYVSITNAVRFTLYSLSGIIYNITRLNIQNAKIYNDRIQGIFTEFPLMLWTRRSGISK